MGLRIFSYLVVRLNLSFLKTSDFHYCIFVVVAFWVLFALRQVVFVRDHRSLGCLVSVTQAVWGMSSFSWSGP